MTPIRLSFFSWGPGAIVMSPVAAVVAAQRLIAAHLFFPEDLHHSRVRHEMGDAQLAV